MKEFVGESLHAAILIGVLGALAWISGQPLLFPSLGPTAYSLVDAPKGEHSTLRQIVGAHLLGVIAGFVAYHLLGSGLVATAQMSPTSMVEARLAASATLAMGLTVGGMLATDLDHAPACATTLIVGLGLLGTLPDTVAIMVGVVVLLGVERMLSRTTILSTIVGRIERIRSESTHRRS